MRVLSLLFIQNPAGQEHGIHDSAGRDIGNTAEKEVPAITGRLADLVW
jgi:hypothetical protein